MDVWIRMVADADRTDSLRLSLCRRQNTSYLVACECKHPPGCHLQRKWPIIAVRLKIKQNQLVAGIGHIFILV